MSNFRRYCGTLLLAVMVSVFGSNYAKAQEKDASERGLALTKSSSTLLSCDFEDDGENANWTIANSSQSNKWYIGSATNHGGNKCLYISSDNGVTNSYGLTYTSAVYAYREVSVASAGTYFVSFDWVAGGESSYDYLRAFMVPTSLIQNFTAGTMYGISYTATPSGWIDIANPVGMLNGSTEWRKNIGAMELTSGSYNLVFLWRNDNSQGTQPPAAIDNIKIFDEFECASIASLNVVASYTSANVDISCEDNGSFGSVQYVLSQSSLTNAELENETPSICNSASISLSGLEMGASYHLYARSFFDNNGQVYCYGNWSHVAFTTLTCGVSQLPLTESFETDVFPAECWSVVYGDDDPNKNSMIRDNSDYTDGSYSFRFSSYNSASDYNQYLISPELAVSDDAVLLFDYRCYGSDDFLYVGMSSTTSSVENFEWTALDYSPSFNNANVYVPAGTKYIAFKYWGDCKYYAWVDNIKIKIPTCLDIASMTVDALHMSARITLSYGGEENTSNSRYVISNRQLSVAELAAAEKIDFSGETIVLNNIESGTTYYLYAQTYFDGNGGISLCEGNWSSVSFTTLSCSVYSLPLAESFESEEFPPACWIITYGNGDPSLNTVIRDNSAHTDGSYSVRFSSYSHSSDYNQYLISPELSVVQDAIMTFDYSCTEIYDRLYVGVSSTTSAVDDFDWTPIDFSGVFKSASVYVPAGTKYVSIRYYGNLSYYSWVDNIKIFVPTCASITDMDATAYNTTASVNLSYDGDASFGNVLYVLSTEQLSSEELDDAEKLESEYPYSMSLEGLEEGTQYYLYAHFVCKPDGHLLCLSSWSEVSFTTGCSIRDLPVRESFESNYFPPQCWTVVYGNGMPDLNPMIYSDEYASDGDNSFRFSSYEYSEGEYNQYLISPQLNVSEDSKLVFDYLSQDMGDLLYVGLSTTTSDIESFTWSDAMNNTTSEFSNVVYDVPAGTQYVALKYYGDYAYYVWVDNVKIFVPSCEVNDINVAFNIDNSTANVSWTSPVGISQWQIAMVEHTSNEMTTDQLLPFATTVQSNYVSLPYEDGVDYDIYIRTYELDNCEWERVNTTLCPMVQNLHNLGNSTFVWNAQDYVNGWSVAYSNAEITDWSAIVLTEVSMNQYIVDAVYNGSLTHFYVGSNCYSANARLWRSITVSTPATEAFYTCDFEDASENSNWTLINGAQANSWYIGTAANNGGDRGLYISNDEGETNNYSYGSSSTVYAYREINFAESGKYGVSFDWHADGETTYDYLRVFLVPADINLNAGSSYIGENQIGAYGMPANCIAIDAESKLNLKSSWQHYTTNINVYESGLYKLVFCWKNDNSTGSQPPAAIDNIILEKPTCMSPEPLTTVSPTSIGVMMQEGDFEILFWDDDFDSAVAEHVSETSKLYDNLIPEHTYHFAIYKICSDNVYSEMNEYSYATLPCDEVVGMTYEDLKATSAKVEWQNGEGNPGRWQVIVSESDDVANATEPVIVVDTNAYVISGLTPETTYYIYVRSYCSDSYLSDWQSIDFETPCAAVTLPYAESFESSIAPSQCWEMNWNYGDEEPRHVVNISTEGDNSFYFPSNWQELISPEISTEKDMLLSFDAFVNGDGYLSYSYRTDLGQHSIGNVESRNWEHVLCFVPREAKRISFEHYGEEAYLDNVVIEPIDCPFVTNVQVNYISRFSAEVSWELLWHEYSQWQVLVSQSSNPENATETPLLVNSTPYRVENLHPETEYYVYVRTYCSEEYQSEWVAGPSFVTPDACTPVDPELIRTEMSKTIILANWGGYFDAYSDESSWEVYLSETELDENDLATVDAETVYSSSYQKNNLTPGVTYYLYVRTYCYNGYYSDWTYKPVTTLDYCTPINTNRFVWTDVNRTSFSIEWPNDYEYEGLEDFYEVYLSETELTESELAAITPEQLQSKSYSRSGLQPGITYSLYVRTYCSNGHYSEWTRIAIPTLIDAMPMNYSQNFNNGVPENWVIQNSQTNGWYVGSPDEDSDESFLFISHDGGQTNEYDGTATSYSYAYCLLRADARGTANISFDWRANGEFNADALHAFMIPSWASPQLVAGNDNGMGSSFFSDTPDNWQRISSPMINMDYWQHYEMTVSEIEIGTYYMVFFWQNNEMEAFQRPAAIDNFVVNFREFSNENDILSYDFEGVVNATIDADNHTVVCEVANSTNLLEVYPEIVVSDYATIDPASNEAVNLMHPVYYNVISETGISQTWTVSATRLPKSAEAEITDVRFDGLMSLNIDSENARVSATMYSGMDITSVRLYIDISDYASINHSQGHAYNFTNPRNFVVTAETGTQKVWTISITTEDAPVGAGCGDPIVVNAGTNLPYLDSNTTEGKSSLFFNNSGLRGEDAVYELIVPTKMMLSIEATSSDPISVNMLYDCEIDNHMWPSSPDVYYLNEMIYEPGTYYFIVDCEQGYVSYDFRITRIDQCFEVNELSATDVQQNAITIAWTPGSDETSWILSYYSDGDVSNEIHVTDTTYTFTGLTPEEDYVISVVSDCGNGNLSMERQVYVSTISSCPLPLNLSADVLRSDEVVLSWEGYNMTQWSVEYKAADASEYNVIPVSSPTVTLSNLIASTAYNIRVRTVCESDTYSEYVSLDISTPCDAVTEFPYTETFDGAIFPPTCWMQERVEVGYGSGINYVNGAWMRNTEPVDGNTTPTAHLADTKAGSRHTLVTVPFEFVQTANGYDISLDVYRDGSSWEEGVDIYLSRVPQLTFSGGDAVYLGFVSKNYDEYFEGVEEVPGWQTFTFNTNKVGMYYIILYGRSNYEGGIYVDNLTVAPSIGCKAPTYIHVEEIGTHSAEIAWTINNAPGPWSIEYSLNGNETQTAVSDSSIFELTGLEAATVYDLTLRIKAICEAGVVESAWSYDTLSFITECDLVSLPMSEDFNSYDSIPMCWWGMSRENEYLENGGWTINNGAVYLPSQPSNPESILATPQLIFDGERNFVVDFNVFRSRITATYPDMLGVYINDEQNDVGATFLGSVPIQNAMVNGLENFVFEIPRNTRGEYYIIFKADGSRAFRFDDVMIREKRTGANILSFSIAEQLSDAVIDSVNNTISVDVDFGTDLTSLAPTFTISSNAVVDYASGVARDFSAPVVYNVVSEDGNTTKAWTVNVSIAAGACPNPTANDISFAVYGDSVEVSIAHIFNETSYNVKVSSEEIDPAENDADVYDASVDVDGDVTTFVVEGLNPHTQYYVYVQSECGRGWTSARFASGCGVYEMPFVEDFSNAINIDCWTIDDANADGKTWTISNGAAHYSYSRSQAANDYLTSPLISIASNAKLMFDYYVSDFSYSEKFSVYVIAGEDTIQVQETVTVRNENVETFGPIDISDYAGQDIRVSIKCESDPYMFKLNITNIKIQSYDYIIDVSSVGNGNISPDGLMDVVEGDSVTFNIVPMRGNELVSLKLDGREVSSEIVDSTYTLSDVRLSHTLVATFTERYIVNAIAGANGTLNPLGEQIVDAGETLAIAILPDEDYRMSSVLVDSVEVVDEMGSNVYIFDSIHENHIIEVQFVEIVYHTIYAEAGEHGSISPSGTVRVADGTSQTFAIIPDEGYWVAAIEVDGVAIPQEDAYEYIFENVTSDHTINVTFEEAIYHTITASCGENGTITPSGDIQVGNHRNASFSIAPSVGYHISRVLVDNVDVASQLVDGTYTFVNVSEDHAIHAEFAINTYTISSYVRGGTMTPSGTVTVNYGASQTFEFEPNFEYELLNVLVDNQVVEVENNSYTFDNVMENHSIVVVFTPMNIVRHTISASASEHGTISPSGNVRVVEGESQQFEIIPDAHCYVSSLLVDGEPVEIVETYTFSNVTEDHTIEAIFETYKHTVIATAGAHGIVSPSGEVVVDEGTDKTFTFEPYPGYGVAEVLVDGIPVEITNYSYTFENVMEDHTLFVSFDMAQVWRIEAQSSDNGSISPSGIQWYNEGSSAVYTFTPDEGYMLENVLVDGQVCQTNGHSYTFENISGHHIIYASFKIVEYVITASSGENGFISPSGEIVVRAGLNQRFRFSPDTGYEVDSVYVDGVSVMFSNNEYMFENVDSSHTIEVTFRHITVSVDEIAAGETSLYPNPNDGAFMVGIAGMNGLVTYQLIDVRGALVDMREVYVEDGYVLEFVYDLKPGTYFARFVSNDSVVIKQFVVK